jgi:cyclophilin family peptidyl-prolyl cis-trans isomerase
VAKRRQTLKCPVCKIEVRASRLDAHMEKVHPEMETRPRSKGKPAPKSMMPAMFAAVAVIAVVVVAGVGIYYLNLAQPEENGEPPVIPPTDSGVYPTTYVRVEIGPRGAIVIGLYNNETPKTVKNFLDLVGQNFFVGTLFHRIVAGFVIQGGGFTPDMNQKPVPFPPINLEINSKLHNTRGTVAMARTTDPNSATTQFFINLVDNRKSLDPNSNTEGYAVFGTVVRGMDIVDSIANAQTDFAPGNTQERSQPVEEERPTLIVTNTRLMGAPDG